MKLKKILIFCILIFYIIFISEASAGKKDILEDDGTDWTTGPDSWKIGYVAGIITGASVANYEVVNHTFYTLADLLGNEFKLEKDSLDRILNKITLAGITIGQIMDGMNDFYNDFSNRRIKMVDAIYIVKMQIKGEDLELIDSQIRYLKMQPLDKKIYLEKYAAYAAFIKKKGSSLTYKEIKNGDFSFEDLLRSGVFIDTSNSYHSLFCYGTYK